MIVNPASILDRGILTNVKNPEKQLQPNGIDITLKKVYILKESQTMCLLSEENRILPEKEELTFDNEGYVTLKGGETYDIEFNEEVDIPINMNGTLVQRSSLNRMGSFFSCGVYDSGYVGKIGAILRPGLDIKVQLNTRLAQFVFTYSDGSSLYNGRYKKGNSHHHS